MYGRLTSTICAKVSRNNCISSKSLSVTQAKCQYKQTCTVTATNNWYGDPCTNIQKYLQVRYQCVRNMGKGTVKIFTVNKHSQRHAHTQTHTNKPTQARMCTPS